MTIARVALPVAAREPFDYWLPAGLDVARGHVVRVQLARRALTGVVVGVAAASEVPHDKLQPVREIVAGMPPLPPDVLALAEFVARYYQEPLGLVIAQMLPPLGAGTPRRRTRIGGEPSGDGAAAESAPTLNADQQRACEAIAAARAAFAPFLLQGVTGSGKTDVYLAAAAATVASGGQVLVLVPEVNLARRLEGRAVRALPGGRTVTLHSRLAAGSRRRAWLAAASGEADVVLGTRLAVFTPL